MIMAKPGLMQVPGITNILATLQDRPIRRSLTLLINQMKVKALLPKSLRSCNIALRF